MLKKFGVIIGLLVLFVLLLMLFFGVVYTGERSALKTAVTADDALIRRGEYLARAGDCVFCHTVAGEQAFGGGQPIASPIGTIYSTNISPDKQTGIGNYTLQDFDNAVRHGVRKNGDSLYPAMPYPSFAVVTDEDVAALYAYFMQGVDPVVRSNQAADIPWPLSMRWPLAAWRMLFAPAVKPFAVAGREPDVARGAYLVQGLGHCGSCHTPRALTLNERAYSDADPNNVYLAGGVVPIDGWMASSLRGDHLIGLGGVSEDALFELLKTGRNEKQAVFGGMADVVNHSLQYLTDEDVRAIARYLKTLPPAAGQLQPFVYDATVTQALRKGGTGLPGAGLYLDNCAACHRSDGKGYRQVFPALAGNPVVQGADPASLINLVLRGHTLKGTRGAVTSFTMPNFAWRLNDREIADLVGFVRTSWGNRGSTVTVDTVTRYRQQLPETSSARQ